MYITNFSHFLDGEGNIPTAIPKEGRELANFVALVIDASTDTKSKSGTDTGIRCFNVGCDGTIKSEFRSDQDQEIHWWCDKCDNEGVISEWKGTRWDNGK